MGQIYKEYLTGARIYSCSACKAHAADHADIYSKSFHGRYGRAYLFNNVVNVCLGPKENRLLITGMHIVADIYCNCCHQVLGWKYSLRFIVHIIPSAGEFPCVADKEQAFEEKEKYKEGRYIIEKAKMTKVNW